MNKKSERDGNLGVFGQGIPECSDYVDALLTGNWI